MNVNFVVDWLRCLAVARKESNSSESGASNKASDSSKKVARAAKAGATPSSSGGDQRSLGFPMALAGVIIAGSALVFFAWNARDVQALQPTFGDHWHAPYGIYDCTIDGFQAPIEDPQTANAGIHTHSDGVIHIHPFSSTATGGGATIGTFLEATDAAIEDDVALVFTNRPELSEGVQCDGEDAVLQIARFPFGETTPSEVITEDLNSYRFGADLEGLVIALAPIGFEIPPPPEDAQTVAETASPLALRTDGLGDLGALDGSHSDGAIGFDEDGNLVGPDGAPILDPETGEPITQASIQDAVGDGEGEGDDDSEDDDSEDDDG